MKFSILSAFGGDNIIRDNIRGQLDKVFSFVSFSSLFVRWYLVNNRDRFYDVRTTGSGAVCVYFARLSKIGRKIEARPPRTMDRRVDKLRRRPMSFISFTTSSGFLCRGFSYFSRIMRLVRKSVAFQSRFNICIRAFLSFLPIKSVILPKQAVEC